MRAADFARLSLGALAHHRLRSFLTGLGITVGISAVILLTSIGEGVQRFVLEEFTQFGTNLIGVVPGKTSTTGVSGAVISNVRPLSIDDSESLVALPKVLASVPVIQGNAQVEFERKQRRTTIYGVGSSAPEVWQFNTASGRFLPDDDPHAARSFVVLGSKVRSELFGGSNPLGKRVRVGGFRFRVIGVMESKGQILGFDLDDAVYIPAAKAMELFNRESLMEIDVLYKADATGEEVADDIRELLISRHGSEDFSITTQEQMMDVLGGVLDKLTIAIGTVRDRTGEIGLLRALGATSRQILILFLGEAIVLSALGGGIGLLIGWGGSQLLHFFVPALPVHTSWPYVFSAELLAAVIGLAAGVIPARHAASLHPIEALRAE
jgi:putative ABC transport system permease protein